MYTPSTDDLANQICALWEPSLPIVTNLANASALIYDVLGGLNWCGFYGVDNAHHRLVLGPFQGQPACTVIPYGKGVCGTAWAQGKVLCVPDVTQFEGHIACSAASMSELVVPILSHDGQIVAVLDLDAPTIGRFDNHTIATVTRAAHAIGQSLPHN